MGTEAVVLVRTDGVVLELPQGEVLLGRAHDAGVVIGQPEASWHHARLTMAPTGIWLEDLQSTNGTWLNGHQLTPHEPVQLQPGDQVQIADWSAVCRAGLAQVPLPARGATVTIGRALDADVCLADPQVSWQHARLSWQGEHLIIEDLGSTNGTFVNERRVRRCAITTADRLVIARRPVQLAGAAAPSVAVGAPLLEARGLWRIVPDARAPGGFKAILQNGSASLQSGRLVSVVGPSGAGKTTFCNAMVGYSPADVGQILFRGMDVTGAPEILHAGLGYVSQGNSVHGELTVQQVMSYAAELRLPPDTPLAMREQRIQDILATLNLSHRLDTQVRQLSGGEQRRINIAVELLTEPDVLVLDEPTSGLDPCTELEVLEHLRQLATRDRVVLVITHSIEIMEHSDELIVVAGGGRVYYHGPPQQALVQFQADHLRRLCDKQHMSRFEPTSPPALPGPPVFGGQPLPRANSGLMRQFAILMRRYLACLAADKANRNLLLLQGPLLGAVFGVVFCGRVFGAPEGHSPTCTGNAVRVLLALALAGVMCGLMNAAREIVKERFVLQRERLGVVRFGPYLASKLIVLGLLALLQISLIICVAGPAVYLSAEYWPAVILIVWGGGMVATAMGLGISGAVRSTDQAMTFAATLIICQVVLSGGLRDLAELERQSKLLYGVLEVGSWLTGMYWSLGGACGWLDVRKLMGDAHIPASMIPGIANTKAETAIWALVGLYWLWAAISYGLGLLAWNKADR